MKRKTLKKVVNNVSLIIASALLVVWIGIPLYWVVKTSFAPAEEVWEMTLPKKPTLQNYIDLFRLPKGTIAEVVGTYATISPTIITPLKNSLIVATVVVVITLIVSTTAAYNLSRFSYRGKRLVSYYVLFAYVFPPFILMVPIMLILRFIGLLNSLIGLSIAQLAYTVPFATYMLRGYFMGVPKDLDEAAMIDGCSRFQAFVRVVLPLSLPGLVTVAIFSFTLSWGDIIFPLVCLNTADKYTLPLHVSFYLWGGEITDPGRLAATVILAGMIPVVLYLAIQRFIRMGLVAGAVKG